MSTFRPCCFSILLVSLAAPSGAQAVDQLSLPDLQVPAGAAGQSVFVDCAHDAVLSGFSLSIRYRPAELAITEVTVSGASAEDLSFFEGTNDPATGEISYGAILDLGHPLPPAQDHRLVRLVFDVKGGAGTTTPIEFVNGLGPEGRGENLLTDDNALAITPLLRSGSVAIKAGYLPPVADAGPDLATADLSTVTLDGSLSFSPVGLPLTFSWSRVSGPSAQPVGGQDAALASYLLPDVAGDEPLVLELAVTDDENTRRTDLVTVTVVDAAQRQAAMAPAPDLAAPLGPGKAIVLAGDLSWGTALEDGLLTGLAFTAGGPGDESRLGSLSVYIDENGNGSLDLDGQDRQAAVRTVPADDARVAFDLLAILPPGRTTRFFLVADLHGGVPAQAWLFIPALLATGLFFRRPGRRSRCGFLAVLLLSLPFTTVACGGGGGGGGGLVVGFALNDPSDVTARGAATGVPAALSGPPIEGPLVRL